MTASPPSTVRLFLDPAGLARRVFLWCLLSEIAFVLLDYHINYGRLIDVGAIRRMTNIAREDGLASWFAVTQTGLLALTAWFTWFLVRARQVSCWRRGGWLILAVMFTYMAVDDGAQLHERFGTLFSVFQEQGRVSAFEGFPSYDWQVLFAPLFGGFGLLLLVFLRWELDDPRAYRGVIAAVGCLAVAVGLDFFEGLDSDHPMNLYSWVTSRIDVSEFAAARFGQTPYAMVDHFSRSLEEFLEMLATTLLWVTLLRHLPSAAGPVTIAFGEAGAR